jgi:hypothetical protein
MKVIFLDVDGVLNNQTLLYHYGFDYIDEGMVDLLKSVVFATKAKVVLSSTWRLDRHSYGLVKKTLEAKGMEIYSKTTKIERSGGWGVPGHVDRVEEILDWLGKHPKVDRYAVVDDMDDAGAGIEANFFQTDLEKGLTSEIASRIIIHLKERI